MQNNSYALILAGGSGTRFWPLSRNTRPKQLLDLFGDGTLLRKALDRLQGLIPAERILILTNGMQEEEVRRQAPELPQENIIAEPARRDTAPAIALGIGLIAARCPEANMLVIPSDQLILNDEAFRELAADALSLAGREKALITIGIKPTWPCPSYGYIERGTAIADPQLRHSCYEVQSFREKPDTATATEYLAKGNYSWNAGMFIWNIPHVRTELQQHTPELAGFIDRLAQTENISDFIRDEFPALTPISIDFALMEKAARVLNFEATFDWDDVGSWLSVAKYLQQHDNGNVSNTPVSARDARGNIAYSAQGKHIALLGVENLIVVDTGDSLLVARQSDADAIKHIVSQLPENLV
ncbi:mannose-1-phosphate guanylyltransferase [Akkermansia glycaniphila]|uniref:Nucleotidyl transferase n=1 Tax=Akkermansia glycaniphila TaxID=1679444 RepID=A0A1C7PDK3_9BACT|nr:sugar phosphate nucleotidyltransferase [Akkermansia glycaniphila]OCA03617.1 mannose-1-phosphate guanyltransferase [Akkermansia glycaniphila]SEH79567.1 nucleotidyl transferase [Akkermansia glycaniphila]